ncbi:MAG: hypothetical protein ACXVRJ_00110 [Gaiellaceae bacterium]
MPTRPTPSRRELLALSAALAGTTLTAAAAVAGLTRHPTAPLRTVPIVQQQQQPAAPAPAEPPDLGG